MDRQPWAIYSAPMKVETELTAAPQQLIKLSSQTIINWVSNHLSLQRVISSKVTTMTILSLNSQQTERSKTWMDSVTRISPLLITCRLTIRLVRTVTMSREDWAHSKPTLHSQKPTVQLMFSCCLCHSWMEALCFPRSWWSLLAFLRHFVRYVWVQWQTNIRFLHTQQLPEKLSAFKDRMSWECS